MDRDAGVHQQVWRTGVVHRDQKLGEGRLWREKERARQQVTFYHVLNTLDFIFFFFFFDITWLLDNFKERSNMFMLYFRNETWMAVWRIFRNSGQPANHEHERKDGGLYRRHSRWRPKDTANCLCVVRERAGILVAPFHLWDKQERRGKLLN